MRGSGSSPPCMIGYRFCPWPSGTLRHRSSHRTERSAASSIRGPRPTPAETTSSNCHFINHFISFSAVFIIPMHLHHYVGIYRLLYSHTFLGRHHQFPACVVGIRELDALFRHFGEVNKRHHLKAARIRQDRSIPSHEIVNTAEMFQNLGARLVSQVIGVGENNFDPFKNSSDRGLSWLLTYLVLSFGPLLLPSSFPVSQPA